MREKNKKNDKKKKTELSHTYKNNSIPGHTQTQKEK